MRSPRHCPLTLRPTAMRPPLGNDEPFSADNPPSPSRHRIELREPPRSIRWLGGAGVAAHVRVRGAEDRHERAVRIVRMLPHVLLAECAERVLIVNDQRSRGPSRRNIRCPEIVSLLGDRELRKRRASKTGPPSLRPDRFLRRRTAAPRDGCGVHRRSPGRTSVS